MSKCVELYRDIFNSECATTTLYIKCDGSKAHNSFEPEIAEFDEKQQNKNAWRYKLALQLQQLVQ